MNEETNSLTTTNENDVNLDSSIMDENTNENVSKTKKRHFNLLAYALVLIPSITLGVFGGLKIKEIMSSGQENELNVDYRTLYPDYDKVYQTYLNASAKDGVIYTEILSPTQMAEIALCLGQREEHIYGEGVGYADAGVAVQQIRSTTIRNGNNYFEESVSSGLVNVHDRMFQINSDDNVTVSMYTSTSVNKDTYAGDYTNSVKNDFDSEGYISHMGRLLSTMTSYIVSEKTVLTGEKRESMYGITSAKVSDDGYIVNIELDPIKGVAAYAIQMKTISSLAHKPPFDYCHLIFNLDKDLNLISLKSIEKYTATKASIPVPASTKSEIVVNYKRGEIFTIPNLDEPCVYRSAM